MNKSQINRTSRFGLCALLAILLASPAVFGQTKNDDILKLIKVSGTEKNLEQVVDAMIAQFRQMPGIPPSFWDGFRKKINYDELLKLYVPIYDKHYSHDDIKKLIAFYESPIGRKMVQVTPAMMQEGMVIGQKWGEKIGEELLKEMNAAGFGR